MRAGGVILQSAQYCANQVLVPFCHKLFRWIFFSGLTIPLGNPWLAVHHKGRSGGVPPVPVTHEGKQAPLWTDRLHQAGEMIWDRCIIILTCCNPNSIWNHRCKICSQHTSPTLMLPRPLLGEKRSWAKASNQRMRRRRRKRADHLRLERMFVF